MPRGRFERELAVAQALAKSSNDGPISSCEWNNLGRLTQDRLMVIARLALKMEEDSRP